ncbi:MAG: helix-turn-helix domain-containing protein [Myxococcaceae bacterium]
MSIRAQKILTWMQEQITPEFPIRQQMLAELFGCSRRTIGRALKELKEANLLVDLNKRHENRCKIYLLTLTPELTPAAQHQLKLYGRTFREMFKMFDGHSGRPTFESCFAQIAGGLRNVTDEEELYHRIFAGFFALPNLKQTDMSWRSEPENRNAGGTYY